MCKHILDQLATLVREIDERDFMKPSVALSQSTIGQHIRHTLEFFICFEQGYKTGVVNYDKRAHDKLIENDKFIALSTINRIAMFVTSLNPSRALKLEAGYDVASDEVLIIDTNTIRELVYNIEHAVHHMALIKIGVRENAPYLQLPQDFGIAASTIRHKETITTSH